MTTYRHLHELARSQHRIVSYQQAVAAGLAPSTLSRWVADGRLTRPLRGVYAFPGALDDPIGRLQASVLAAPAPCLAFGRTALWLHGVTDDRPPRAELLIPHGRKAPSIPGITVHRTRTLVAPDHSSARGVPSSSVARALADIGLTESPRTLHPLLLDAVQRRRTTIEDVAARAALRLDVRSRRALAFAIGRVEPHRADSILELEVRERLHAAGVELVPGPVTVEVAGRSYSVDIVVAGTTIGVECDGLAYHADRRSLERDHRKSNALQLAGWTLLRVSWTRMWHDWAGFLSELRAATS